MSTYLYLECRSHTPHLSSDGEVGQHLYDLPRIIREIARRELFADMDELDTPVDYGNHFTNNAARFLARHRDCIIGIRDEYGKDHPIAPESES